MTVKLVATNICPYCGGRNYQTKGEGYFCPDCKTQFSWETVSKVNEWQTALKDVKQEALATARQNLFSCVGLENRSSTDIRYWCGEVKKYVAKDFIANFYLACEDGSSAINLFLKTNDVPKEYVIVVLNYLLRSIKDEKCFGRIEKLIEKLGEKEKALCYQTDFEKLINDINNYVYATNRPRDVFLAYSGKDMSIVLDTMEYLESQGHSCFVAYRNLRHGIGAKENYCNEIREAMKHCKCLVYISTENSRHSGCWAIDDEIPYIFDHLPQMKRIEYLKEPYGERTSNDTKRYLQTEVFYGLEWCTKIEDVSYRVMQHKNYLRSHGGNDPAPIEESGSTPVDPKVCDHEYIEEVVKPTCLADGYTKLTCRKCNFTRKMDYTDPIDHRYSAWRITKLVTCETDGEEKQKCEMCQKETVRIVPATGHKFNPWKTITPATSTEKGTKRRICANCGKAETEEIPIEANASTTKQSDKDSKSGAKENEIRYHNYVAVKTVAPTCTEKGYTLMRCTCGCGDEYKDNLTPIKPHVFGEWKVFQAPTCLKEGEERQKCKSCTKYNGKPIAPKGHKYGEWRLTKRATCTEEGAERRNCTGDGCTAFETRPLPAIGHKYGYDKILTAPTCTKEGKVEKMCSGCGKTITETVPATGHKFGDWKETKAPTCTEEGQREKKCTACGETVKEKVPAKGHNYQWEIKVQATCTKEGKKEYKCATCGKGANPKTTSTGHSEINAVTMATPTEKDKKENKCTACEELSNVEIIPAKGHSYQWITTIPATCTEEGKKEYQCTACGNVSKTETLSATGHKFTEWKRKKLFSKYRFCEKCFTMEKNTFGRVTIKTVSIKRTGNMVYFGQYPQSEVTDSTLKRTLSNLAGTLPARRKRNGWTSYKYYIGKAETYGESEKEVKENRNSADNSTDFMWYKDVTHNGERYRGVYFTKYRPYFCSYESTKYNTNQNSNGYTPSTLYWFKYEPIQWRILEEKNGYATLLAEKIIDSQQYNVQYKNSYAKSDIRAWLNNLFYRTAFTSEQQSLIQAVTVDNSARSTNSDRNATEWNSGENSYSCRNTTDKVWLLSEQEVTKASYGFNTDPKNYDTVRRKTTSEYAKCQGAYTNTDTKYKGKGCWWLRSPYCSGSYIAWYVNLDGNTSYAGGVYYTNLGVVPALKIRLS